MTICKPGDLAIVIHAKDEGNIGRIVTVLRAAVNGETFIALDGYRLRLVGDSHEACWVIEACGLKWDGHPVERRAFRDSWMRPVSGLPVTDDIELEEKV